MPERFTVPTREWGGDAKRTLVQGLHIHTPSGTRIVNQADDVPGQAQQDVVFRCHKSNNDYIGAVTVKRAGHGSSVGLESTGDRSMRFWFGHEQQQATGYVTYAVGQTGTVAFTPVGELPYADVSIDQAAGIICLRNGNRFRGYRLDSVKAKEPEVLWEFSIPGWGNRFQGHLIANGRLAVHRDLATKSTSRAHIFDYNGKQTNVFDTTNMGDEAEGFVAVDGDLYAVKRTGGTGPSRIVEATRLMSLPKVEEPIVAKYELWRGVRVNPESVPSLDAIALMSGPNVRISPTQGGFNRGGVSASAGTHDGGAAVDLSVAGWSQAQIDAVVRLMRECGWAAWYRPYLRNVWPSHIHGIRVDDSTASRGAKLQVIDYMNGRNGLANRGRDTGPAVRGVNGERFPTWAQSIHNPGNKPKTLADILAELGPVADVSVAACNKSRTDGTISRHTAILQAWLNLAIPEQPLDVDGLWSAAGPTQDKLDAFRKSLGWTDFAGPLGVHSLTMLHDNPAVAASNPIPVRETLTTKEPA
jgi:hypothetical protein